MSDEEQPVVNGSTEGASPEVEARARDMGWVPKEEFRGPEERWKPADEFVRKGEEIMPLLRANNRKLTDELHNTRAQLEETQRTLQANQAAIEELKAFSQETTKERREDRKRELLGEIVAAREAGNVEREVELTSEMTKLDAPPPKVEPKPTPRQEALDPAAAEAAARQTPVWKEWAAANPWFGADQERTDYAEFAARQLRLAGNRDSGRPFLDAVAEKVNRTFGAQRTSRDAPSRVEGARGGNGATGAGRTYADLPANARADCDRFAARLVGVGRKYPTEAEWRKAYVSKYYQGEE